MYPVELQALIITNRIAVLEARGPHNANIVNKLRRKLRQLYTVVLAN